MGKVTACVLDCPDRCSIVARAEADGIRLRGNPEHPYTRGFVCPKIRRYPGRLTSPHRIREPWIRRGDRFQAATWGEALDAVGRAIEDALAEDPASILLVRGAGSMGVSKSFAEYVFGTLGARFTKGSLCDAAGIAAIEADAGRLDMNDPRQIEAAEAIVLWGKNPKASSIHTAAQVASARKRGVPVAAVNPDASAVEALAGTVVRVRPGTDRFLALACTKILLGAPARPPPWGLASNRERFEALLSGQTLPELLDACGVGEADARSLTGLYAKTPRVATIVGLGLQRYRFAGQNVRAIHALAFLAGALGVPGGGLYYNIPSARHLERPRPARAAPGPLLLPTLASEISSASPPIRFAWISCSNFLNQAADAKAARRAFGGIATVVAVEPFWTETARLATVVLPPALWLEEEDLVPSYWQNALSAVRQVVEPPSGCRTDFEILREVGRRAGLRLPFETVDDWLSACLPDAGPSLSKIREGGWALLDWPEVAWGKGFGHEDGRFRLLESVDPEPGLDPLHPLHFLTLIRKEALNSQLLPEEQKRPLQVRIHPETAAAAGLRAGSPVRLVSAAGELEGEVHLDRGLHPGAVACPRGGWLSLGLGVNELTEVRVTDAGNGAAFYATGVRLEKGLHAP